MSAFFLFDNVGIHNPQTLVKYVEKLAPVVAQHGGKYRIVGGKVIVLEGQWQPTYPVLIEFNTFQEAKAWYHSEDYAPLRRFRHSTEENNAVLIEGLANA